MKKILLLITFCILHFTFSTSAQNFLWGRSGGSAQLTGGPDDETIRDVATDKNGNVYVLSQVDDLNRNIMGQPLTGYGYNDIMLASFKPDGTLRWTKIIGGSEVDDGFWLATDASDGVYFCGAVNSSNNVSHIDADATLPNNYQYFLLVKYDTAGNYKWHRQPEASTLPDGNSWNFTRSVAMDVDDAGNTFWLMSLYPGVYGGSLTVSTQGLYIVKYDATGNFSYVKPEVEADMLAFSGMTLKIDDINNRFYLSGTRNFGSGTMTMGGAAMNNAMYIGCFNLDGSFNWKRENSFKTGGFAGRPAIDVNGNIYLAGSTIAASAGFPNDNFNGYEITHGGGSGTPFVVKMDKNGNNIWGADAEVNAASGAIGIGLRNNEVIVSGAFPGLLQWPGYSGIGFNKPVNDRYDMFITRFDANNGAVIGMDRVTSSFGNNEYPTCMAGDGKGNVYVGGEFDADMQVNSLNNLTSTGGQTDWFVVKYGDMWPSNVNAFVSEKDVIVYPNPAQSNISISNAGLGTSLQLCDMAGRTYYSQMLNRNLEKLDVSAYPSGTYLIQLTDKNGGRIVKKITKE